MQTPENDTISAIITPIGTGAIAVIRVSGPRSFPLADEIFRGNVKLSSAASHTVHFGRIVDQAGVVVDEVLATVFRSPHSYTSEDIVEFSCHGSPYIARRVLELVVTKGARPAGPGEFTRRAFLNGRLDLSQAEAVADLVSADSRASHDLAVAQLRGSLSGKIEGMRRRIVDLCSMLELELDFSEEGLELVKRDRLKDELGELDREMAHLIDSFELGKMYREGVRIVLAGATNVGKSSILNALVREDRAIVTDVSGTTRDTIEEPVSIGGMKFTVVDTAGLRSTNDIVEVEGIRRTREQLQHADLILLVIDPTQNVDSQKDAILSQRVGLDTDLKNLIIVLNKADVVDLETMDHAMAKFPGAHTVKTSAATGMGVLELERTILSKFQEGQPQSTGESVVLANIRQKESLIKSRACLEAAAAGADSGSSPEFLAVDLREALTHLSHVVGVDISEEVLNNIFSRFCIGK